jgi:hypothetical protein
LTADQEKERERAEEGLAEVVALEDAWRATEGLTPCTKPHDLAHQLLLDGKTSSTNVYDANCYICRDPEFSEMGLPLCRECPDCKEHERGLGHVPADEDECTVCGFNEREATRSSGASRERLRGHRCQYDRIEMRAEIEREIVGLIARS